MGRNTQFGLQMGLRASICVLALDHLSTISPLRQSEKKAPVSNEIRLEATPAHIKMGIGPELAAVLTELKTLPVVEPHTIRRAPVRRRRSYLDAKTHWTQVAPEILTREFARLRDMTACAEHLEPVQRPSFHELRGLGADLYRQSGMPEEQIQALLGHSDISMTRVYLDRRGTEERWTEA